MGAIAHSGAAAIGHASGAVIGHSGEAVIAAASEAALAAAEAYEALLVPGLFRPSTLKALALAGITAAQAVVDVACGTGIGARLAAQRVGRDGRVLGIDSDAGMLAVARRVAAGPEAAAPQFLCADALALPVGNAAFDAALCLQGLQFFADPERALAELHRVIAAGGRLVVTTWGPLERMPGHDAVYASLEAHGVDTRSPRRGFALDEPHRVEALLRRGGFRDIEAAQHDADLQFPSAQAFVDGMLRGAPYTRRALAGLPEPARDACRNEACARVSRFESARGLELPARVNIVLARR